MFRLYATCCIVIVMLCLALPASASSPPGTPATYFGNVRLNGAAVPDGTIVTAVVNGVAYPSEPTAQSVYGVVISGGSPGDTIEFTLNGLVAAQTATWTSGSTELGLTFTDAPGTPSIAVSLPNGHKATPGSLTTIPVRINSDTTGKAINAYEFVVQVDATILDFVGISKAGTLSNGWQIVTNESSPGTIRFAAYGIQPLSGSGTLLSLQFNVLECADSNLGFSTFMFNEGNPTVQTTNGGFACQTFGLSGAVTYKSNGNTISNAEIRLTGATTATTQSDASGNFLVETMSIGSHHLTAVKQGDLRDGLSALDANYILEYRADKRDLTPDQKLVADVSQNDDITPYDAYQIALFVLTGEADGSVVGQWQFTPASYSYPAVDAPKSAQNFTAILYGDVTGNWGSGAARSAHPGTLDATLQGADKTGLPGQSVEMPISVTGEAANDVRAFQFDLRFDPKILSHEELNLTTDYADNWHYLYSERTPGHVKIIAYGDGTSPGTTPMFLWQAKLIGSPGDVVEILAESERFNEAPFRQLPVVIGEVRVHYSLHLPFTVR